MTLHPAIGRNRFCGPGALAIVVGISTDDASRTLRDVTGRRSIHGVEPDSLVRAFRRHGMRLRPIPVADGWSLIRWARADDIIRHGRYVVMTTGHYCVVRIDGDGLAIEVSDNKTVYPVRIEAYRGRRKHVRAVWKVDEFFPR